MAFTEDPSGFADYRPPKDNSLQEPIINTPAPVAPAPAPAPRLNTLNDIPGIGVITFPVNGVGMEAIQSVIGQPRGSAANPRSHQGIDIFAPEGANVFAATAGEIIKVGENVLGGMRVSVEDPQGNIHYYAHLSGFAQGIVAKNGDTPGTMVSSGALLGYVGSTGNADGKNPHLHYSINENQDNLVDPVQLFKSNQITYVDRQEVPGGATSNHEVTGGGDSDLDQLIAENWPNGDIPEDVQWKHLPPELQEVVTKNLGYYASYIQHTELGPILIRGALLEQADDLILNAVKQTDWWATTDVMRRQWEMLVETDLGEANRQRQARTATMRDAAGKAGIPLDEAQLGTLSEESLKFGWNEAQIIDAIVSEDRFDPNGEDPQALGDLRTVGENIQTMASRYMLTYSPTVRYELAKRIASGELEEDDLRSQFITDAKGRFPHFSGQLDNGYTIAQLMDTRANEVGRILGIDADEVDFLDDPRFQSILEYDDGTGEGTRSMNLMETRKHLATLPEYENTADAHARGSSLANTLLKKFGAI
jgi:hypothetical protein